jgi:hypothetical protein
LLEELDESGEFYIDRGARVLYFWPPGPSEGSADRSFDAECAAGADEGRAARHAARHHVRGDAGGRDRISGGRRACIENCTIRNTRQLAIRISGGTAHRIDHCDIYDTGAGGLVVEGGDRKTLTAAKHE